jgi:uncharacterized protein involved in exopolysaccharide biosynthesis
MLDCDWSSDVCSSDLSVMRGSLTENNPEFRAALSELTSLRTQLSRAQRDEPGEAQGGNAQYIAKYREFRYYETLFELFAKQYELARADEARDGGNVQVVDPALVPEYKSKPKRAMLAVLATMLAFMLGCSWVLVTNAFSNYARAPDAADKLAGIRYAFGLRRRSD